MKSRIRKAPLIPLRFLNSLKGSITASFKVLGAPYLRRGSLINKVMIIPGNINNPVTRKTNCQSKKSASINDKEPGIRLEILYALTCIAFPIPNSESESNSLL